MTIHATDEDSRSLEERRIDAALAKIDEWRAACICADRPEKKDQFCESFGCASLNELACILRGASEAQTEG